MTQAFLYPPSLHADEKQMKVHRERKVYIIRDGIDFKLAFIRRTSRSNIKNHSTQNT